MVFMGAPVFYTGSLIQILQFRCGVASDNTVAIWKRLRYDCTGSDNRMVAQHYSWQYDRPHPKPAVFANSDHVAFVLATVAQDMVCADDAHVWRDLCIVTDMHFPLTLYITART